MRDLTRTVVHPQVDQTGFASLSVPVQRASTIVFDSARDYAERYRRGADGYSYGLGGTPTTRALEAQLSALEGGAGTVLLPSGQAAIALVFLTVPAPGATVLIPDNVYPAVRRLCADFLAPRGIGHRVYDARIGAGIAGLLTPDVGLLWIESPGSTTLEVADVPAMVAAARAAGVPTGCDNTWATPLLFKPLAHGVDLSMQALTKYVGGHSDLLMGAVSVADPALHARLRATMRLLGLGVSPDDCALALRGLETLGVRLGHVGGVASELAKRLAAHGAVRRVLYPAIEGAAGHELWRRDFSGASGLFTLVLRPELDDRLDAALATLETFAIGASWGGTRSLVAPVALDAGRMAGARRLLRISIGLEDPRDLYADLRRVLDRLEEGRPA